MAATVWKGFITFGLISIPVRLFTAARNERVSFHMIHKECGSRIKQQLYCPQDERVVERSEIVKGFEMSKGQYVLVDDAEVKKIAPPSTDNMEILQFVKVEDVDPVYYDASYYIVPEEPGRKAYSLLLETTERTGYAAVAKIGMHQREYIVIIRPQENGLLLHTVYYPDEVRAVPEFNRFKPAELKPQEVQLAEQLVTSLAGPFKPEQYEDEYRKRLIALVEAKAEGETVRGTPHKTKAPVIDLMEALKKSLETKGKAAAKKPAESAKTRKKAS